jgi:threonine/homoserine/homoserine lactone efflux protein
VRRRGGCAGAGSAHAALAIKAVGIGYLLWLAWN